MKNNILVTAIGSMSASCVLESLHNIKDINIFGSDICPVEWQTNLDFLTNFYKVPKFNQSNYVNTILEICLLNNIGFIFPLTDVEIDVINENRNIFEDKNIVICISEYKTILQCRDKTKIGSNIPFFSLDELQKKNIYPIIAKPKTGRSSEGKFLLENPTQLSIVKNMNDYIFQPYIDGQIITVDVVRDKNYNTELIPRKELLRTSNGAGTVVEIFKDNNLFEIVLQIANNNNILGCVNFEFIYYNEEYYLMDINPRFSAGIGFSCSAGYNFVIEHLNVFQNKKISKLQEYKTGIFAKETNFIQLGSLLWNQRQR